MLATLSISRQTAHSSRSPSSILLYNQQKSQSGDFNGSSAKFETGYLNIIFYCVKITAELMTTNQHPAIFYLQTDERIIWREAGVDGRHKFNALQIKKQW